MRTFMNRILKLIPLLATMLMLSSSFAEYRVNLPLETTQGGNLPNGSISFGNTGNEGEPPSTNCIYSQENGSMATFFKQDVGSFKAGDKGYIYQGKIIGYYSPSNGYPSVPAGISAGVFKIGNPISDNYEICVTNPNSYPALPNIGDAPPPIDPENPDNNQSGPDWTPECILNTSTDYAAISNTTGKREFHSIQFGLNHLVPSSWNYVPPDYDRNNPTSYVYFDQSEQTGDSRVSGPNPDFSYSQICRVRKRDL